MKFICETFLRMSVIFRAESNEPSFTIIGYSDTTVSTSKSFSNHAIKDLISYITCYSTIIVKIVSLLDFI